MGDDAEKSHCMHADLWGVVAVCGCQIIPAAAPDELTALRDGLLHEIDRIGAENLRHLARITELQAERDALRERIRALVDKWEELRGRSPNQAAAELRACVQELRQLLGDS